MIWVVKLPGNCRSRRWNWGKDCISPRRLTCYSHHFWDLSHTTNARVFSRKLHGSLGNTSNWNIKHTLFLASRRGVKSVIYALIETAWTRTLCRNNGDGEAQTRSVDPLTEIWSKKSSKFVGQWYHHPQATNPPNAKPQTLQPWRGFS